MCFLAIHGQRSVLQCKSCKISAKITSLIRQENLHGFSENDPMNTFFNIFQSVYWWSECNGQESNRSRGITTRSCETRPRNCFQRISKIIFSIREIFTMIFQNWTVEFESLSALMRWRRNFRYRVQIRDSKRHKTARSVQGWITEAA